MGKAERPNGAFGKSDIEGKAAMGSGERAGKRTSFKWAGAHESTRGSERVSICGFDTAAVWHIEVKEVSCRSSVAGALVFGCRSR
jgi:hypothetical protein